MTEHSQQPKWIKEARDFLRRKGYMYADLDKHPELLIEFAEEFSKATPPSANQEAVIVSSAGERGERLREQGAVRLTTSKCDGGPGPGSPNVRRRDT